MAFICNASGVQRRAVGGTHPLTGPLWQGLGKLKEDRCKVVSKYTTRPY